MLKNFPANAGAIRDMGSISESGRSPGGGQGNPFQYSFFYLMYLYLSVLGLTCSWAPLVAVHGLEAYGISVPQLGINPTSVALEGGFLTPGPPGKSPLQYSCLENPTDREAWWAMVHRVTKRHD